MILKSVIERNWNLRNPVQLYIELSYISWGIDKSGGGKFLRSIFICFPTQNYFVGDFPLNVTQVHKSKEVGGGKIVGLGTPK